MLSTQEFAAKIKDKYPQYADVDDLELAKKMLDKYPQYKSKVQIPKEKTSILNKAKDVALKGAAIAGGLEVGGRVLKSVGKGLYGATLPPDIGTAKSIQDYKAGVTNVKPRTLVDTALEAPLVQKGNTRSLSSNIGMMGTRSQLGVQAKTAMKNMFDKKITPIFKKADKDGVKFVFKDMLDDAIKAVKNNKTRSPQKQAEVVDDVVALFDDLQGTTSLGNLDKLKSEIATKLPKRYYDGRPITSSLQEARGVAAKAMRDKVHSTIKNKYGVNSAKIYQDYGNLKGLSEVGKKSMTQGGTKGGFGTFTRTIADELATPITTTLGKLSYKGGHVAHIIPRAAWKGIKKLGKSGLKKLKGGIKSGTIPGVISTLIVGEATPDNQALDSMIGLANYLEKPDNFIELKGGTFQAVSKKQYEEYKNPDGSIVIGDELYDKDGNFKGTVQ